MIGTERLILRGWRTADVSPFHKMGQDAEVMRHIGPPISLAEAAEAAARQNAILADYGSCFYALERREDGAFLGFCGIKPGAAGTPIDGLPEIGWRLVRHAWGQGYAREAAQASLERAWAHTEWPAVHAITTPGNAASWGLMIRLGMVRATDGDFAHPALPVGDPLRPHITYRIYRPDGR